MERLVELEPGLRRLRAPNPSPMTFTGTNTYLLGTDRIAVIDPGPQIADHLQSILRACDGAKISDILVTHSHLDHSPLARRLSAETGAPVHAFGDAAAGRSLRMRALAETGATGGGEGIDADFVPDAILADGETIRDPGWGEITAIWTPGHLSNHLSFAWQDILFTGDHIMAWASSLVSPPDGDLTQFMDSCRRLLERSGDRTYHPGHGEPVDNPVERVRWLVEHRLERERQILRALEHSKGTPAQIARRVYHDVDEKLLPAAERNVLAHLIDLETRGLVVACPTLGHKAVFSLA